MQVFPSLGQLPDGAEKKEMENQRAQELQTSFSTSYVGDQII